MKIKRKYEKNLGIIYPIFDTSVKLLQCLTLVEIVKNIFLRNKRFTQKQRYLLNHVIDCYIVFKWMLIILFWIFNFSGILVNIIVFYLLLTNLSTYFFYHVWDERNYDDSKRNSTTIRKRMVSLILSYLYSVLLFAYIYGVLFSSYFHSSVKSDFLQYILFSFTNSIFNSNNLLTSRDIVGYFLMGLQQFITLIYMTIIFARSVGENTK